MKSHNAVKITYTYVVLLLPLMWANMKCIHLLLIQVERALYLILDIGDMQYMPIVLFTFFMSPKLDTFEYNVSKFNLVCVCTNAIM